MSGRSVKIAYASVDWKATVPVLRYVLGSTLIVAVASLMNYDLAYLTSVLGLGYIAPGARPLTLKQAVGFVVLLAVLTFSAVLFTEVFQDYPLVFMPLLLLALFWIYYTDRIPMMVKLFALISLVLIPFLSIDSAAIGAYIAIILVFNAFMAVLLTQFVFLLFPLSDADERYVKEKAAAEKLGSDQRFEYARKIIFLISPVILLYYMFQWSSSVLVLTFVTILTVSPALAKPKVGLVMIVANVLGGLFGIMAYEMLVMAPSFLFMLLLTLLVGFTFAERLFSDSKFASIFGSAFSTFLLILGTVTASDADAGSKVWERVIQIALAVIYVVVAFGIADRFEKWRKSGMS